MSNKSSNESYKDLNSSSFTDDDLSVGEENSCGSQQNYSSNLWFTILTINKFSKKALINKYNSSFKEFNILQINYLIFDKKNKLTTNYKEIKVSNSSTIEFKLYTLTDLNEKIMKLGKYYKIFSQFFCIAFLRNLKINSLIHDISEKKAKLFYKRNLGKKVEKNENRNFSVNSFYERISTDDNLNQFFNTTVKNLIDQQNQDSTFNVEESMFFLKKINTYTKNDNKGLMNTLILSKYSRQNADDFTESFFSIFKEKHNKITNLKKGLEVHLKPNNIQQKIDNGVSSGVVTPKIKYQSKLIDENIQNSLIQSDRNYRKINSSQSKIPILRYNSNSRKCIEVNLACRSPNKPLINKKFNITPKSNNYEEKTFDKSKINKTISSTEQKPKLKKIIVSKTKLNSPMAHNFNLEIRKQPQSARAHINLNSGIIDDKRNKKVVTDFTMKSRNVSNFKLSYNSMKKPNEKKTSFNNINTKVGSLHLNKLQKINTFETKQVKKGTLVSPKNIGLTKAGNLKLAIKDDQKEPYKFTSSIVKPKFTAKNKI